ncbi:TPA_asm: hypothetical protein GBW74_22920, partial [Salmonella enterica subsp. enterica serovar Mbandaka]|nr:hypothetical protein [Salmonella enterica subsp. enterica serovar Mbandaka]
PNIELYERDILAKLNPEQTWNELHLLMGNVEPVLMCWEKPGEFCHQQLVARWFRRELGISVEEYDPRATPQFDLF